MIQAPINVSPQNTAVALDANSRFTISGTFKGDKATTCFVDAFNSDTGAFILTVLGNYNVALTNNDAFDIAINSPFPADLNWGIQYTIMFVNDYINDLSVCDMYIGRAHVQSNASSGQSYILIEDGIDWIYNFAAMSSSTTKSRYYNAVIAVKIGHTFTTFATSYNTTTGTLNLHDSLDAAYASGTVVKLYANYIITRPYCIKISSKPTLTLSTENTLFGYRFETTYDGSVFPKSHEFTVGGSKSGKVYSADMRYYYPNSYPVVTDEETYSFDSFIASCAVEFANGIDNSVAHIVPSSDRTGVTALSDYVIEADNDKGATHIDWTIDDWVTSKDYFWSCMSIYRKCIETGEESYIGTYFGIFGENVDDEQGIRNVDGIHDVTAANGLTYEYALIPTRPDYESVITVDNYIDGKCYQGTSKLDVGGWTITAIYPKATKFDDGTNVYQYGDTWKFIGDISDSTIPQNTGKVLNVGSEQFPILCETDLNYMSGTFTALLSQIVCPNNTISDDITLVKAWRAFITQHCQFILKSIKGDVWVVNVTDNPSTTYQNGEKLTSVSFNWAECEKVENITAYKQGLNIFGRYIDRLSANA